MLNYKYVVLMKRFFILGEVISLWLDREISCKKKMRANRQSSGLRGGYGQVSFDVVPSVYFTMLIPLNGEVEAWPFRS